MSYFTAVVARAGAQWSARDVDLEELESLDDLADSLRDLETDDEPVIALIEREDAWWALVRVDGDEDPRLFVSDAAGAAASSYAGLLEVADDDEAAATWAGDLDLLADLGTSPEAVQQMCEDEVLPLDALAAIGEAAGFGEVLDSLR